MFSITNHRGTFAEFPMHTQKFKTPWPIVLHEVDEYVALTNLSLGEERDGVVSLSVSRQLVTAELLNPYINKFREEFVVQYPKLRLEIGSTNQAEHEVVIRYGR